MRYETKTNFGKRAGISRQAVYKLIAQGKLVVGATGKLDVNHPTNRDYLSTKKGGLIPVSKKEQKPVVEPEKTKPEQKKLSTQDLDIETVQIPADLETISHSSANRLKTIEQIRSAQIKNDNDRKILILRETAQRVFSKLYMIDVNQWRTLAPNLSPEIAAIVGTDDNEMMLKISELIDKEVFTILKQVKRIFNDFLKEQKAEEIDDKT